MGAYKCEECEWVFDDDENLCYEHPFMEIGLLCEDCHSDFGCYSCGEVKKENKFCKITDQWYCDNCV